MMHIPEDADTPGLANEALQPVLAIAHTTFAAHGVLALVQIAYPSLQALTCTLIRMGWNDTYRITTKTDSIYIVRLYGADRHSRSALQYELALLLHLATQGVSVSVPIARPDTMLLTPIMAPEGGRFLALFTVAPGSVPEPFPLGNAAQSVHFGRSLALLHTAADSFAPHDERPPHDLRLLLERSLALLRPFFQHRPQDWNDLLQYAHVIELRFAPPLANDLDWGPIHGDAFSANATLVDDRVTWFDFDLCGPGWRLFDLAGAYESAMGQERTDEERQQVWLSFLEGYRENRPVTEETLACLPTMRLLEAIYFMAVNLEKIALYGGEWFGSDNYFTLHMKQLRVLAENIK